MPRIQQIPVTEDAALDEACCGPRRHTKALALFAVIRSVGLVATLALLPGNVGAGEAGSAGRSPASKPVVIDGFDGEKLSGWVASSHFWADDRGHASDEELVEIGLNREAKYIKNGKGTLKVVSWPARARRQPAYVTLTKRPVLSPPKGADTLSLWLHSGGDKGTVTLRLFNSNTWANANVGIRLNFVGWRRFTFHKSEWHASVSG